MRFRIPLTACLAFFSLISSYAQPSSGKELREKFKTPPYEFRAIFPFLGAGGSDYNENSSIPQQLDNIYRHYGFGGVLVSPTTDQPFVARQNVTPGYLNHIGNGLQNTLPAGSSPWLMILPPGISPYKYEAPPASKQHLKPTPLPAYLSNEYFSQLKEILAYSKEKGRKVIFYDEVGYPSGIANHTTPEKFYRKRLDKSEERIKGPVEFQKQMPTPGVLMAVVAMNQSSLERIDLTPLVKNEKISWKVPPGDWKISIYNCITTKAIGSELDYCSATDYLDPEAVNWFVDKVYEPHAREVGEYFGTTLFQTFFDDVGMFDEEKTWTNQFNEKFKQRTGLNPSIYYPALWENIGPETEAARVAFFDTRAELLADGFPKIVTNWGTRNKVEVSGHCPGNYDPQPVDMNGDPFKYYRAQPIPMVDVIFGYPTGRDGFKLISDGADYYDKPVVAAETFSNFSPAGKTSGYRRLMELYIRGVNRLMGSGLPTINGSEDSTSFAEWVGRHSMMLQGGQRVSEIAIYYPIADLQAFFHFDAPEYGKDSRWGTFVPYHTDYLSIGEMLLEEAHRDFTFVHPDFLLSDKIKVKGSTLALENKVNAQNYKVLILPGQKVISLKVLEKIQAYYKSGGIVISTSLLPSKASELTGDPEVALANDHKVQSIIQEMFGIDSSRPMPLGVTQGKTGSKNGKTVFIGKPDGKILAQTMSELGVEADVSFEGNPSPRSGGGAFSYVHKKKKDCEIYYFANSTDDSINTFAEVRGKIRPEQWNPATGQITSIEQVQYSKRNGQSYTRFPLTMKAVSSTFIVSK